MNKIGLNFATSVMMVVATGTFAQQPRYTSIGPGAARCGQYIDAERDALRGDVTMENIFLSWMQGLLTGMNFERALAGGPSTDMIFLPDPASIKAAISKYCRDNPLENISMSGIGIFTQLKNAQGKR